MVYREVENLWLSDVGSVEGWVDSLWCSRVAESRMTLECVATFI